MIINLGQEEEALPPPECKTDEKSVLNSAIKMSQSLGPGDGDEVKMFPFMDVLQAIVTKFTSAMDAAPRPTLAKLKGLHDCVNLVHDFLGYGACNFTESARNITTDKICNDGNFVQLFVEDKTLAKANETSLIGACDHITEGQKISDAYNEKIGVIAVALSAGVAPLLGDFFPNLASFTTEIQGWSFNPTKVQAGARIDRILKVEHQCGEIAQALDNNVDKLLEDASKNVEAAAIETDQKLKILVDSVTAFLAYVAGQLRSAVVRPTDGTVPVMTTATPPTATETETATTTATATGTATTTTTATATSTATTTTTPPATATMTPPAPVTTTPMPTALPGGPSIAFQMFPKRDFPVLPQGTLPVLPQGTLPAVPPPTKFTFDTPNAAPVVAPIAG